MATLKLKGPGRRCSHRGRSSAASGIDARYVIADHKCGLITRISFRRRRGDTVNRRVAVFRRPLDARFLAGCKHDIWIEYAYR